MKVLDRFFQTVAPNETHRVEGSAVRVMSEAIYRHNARMLQPTRDLGFDQEARAGRVIIGKAVRHFLDGHTAVQFLVVGYVNLSQSTASVRQQNAKALPGGSRDTDTSATIR